MSPEVSELEQQDAQYAPELSSLYCWHGHGEMTPSTRGLARVLDTWMEQRDYLNAALMRVHTAVLCTAPSRVMMEHFLPGLVESRSPDLPGY